MAWQEDEGCFICGLKRVERAHIVPYSLGGSNEPTNYALLCSMHHEDAPDVGTRAFFEAWLERSKRTPYEVARARLAVADALELWGHDDPEDGIDSLGPFNLVMGYLHLRLGEDAFRTRWKTALEAAQVKLGGVGVHSGRFSHGTRVLIMRHAMQEMVSVVDEELETEWDRE